jgi:hypothetical protein
MRDVEVTVSPGWPTRAFWEYRQDQMRVYASYYVATDEQKPTLTRRQALKAVRDNLTYRQWVDGKLPPLFDVPPDILKKHASK